MIIIYYNNDSLKIFWNDAITVQCTIDRVTFEYLF